MCKHKDGGGGNFACTSVCLNRLPKRIDLLQADEVLASNDAMKSSSHVVESLTEEIDY